MNIKRLVKSTLSFIYHPIIKIRLLLSGGKNIYIGPQMTINKPQYFHVGNGFSLGRNSRFLFVEKYHGGEYKPGVKFGDNISIGNRFSLLSAAPIEIGDNCLIAGDVLITSENHGMDIEASDSYALQPLECSPVRIGKGCWLGEKSMIMPGVTLGDRCIVAAGAVVTKSFPDKSLVGGVPAKLLKRYNSQAKTWERV